MCRIQHIIILDELLEHTPHVQVTILAARVLWTC